MSFTNYLEHATLDYIFGGTSFTPSGIYYIGLSTTTPAEDGTNFTEPASLSGYARASITNDKSNWSTATQTSTSGEVHNITDVTFGISSGNWGTITHFGIFDALTGGNLLAQSSVDPQAVSINNTISFPSGALSMRID